METTNRIIKSAVPAQERMSFLPEYFGPYFMAGEPLVYDFMGKLCPDYRTKASGMWRYEKLSNGGFLMVPEMGPEKLPCQWVENWFQGDMSPEAAAIVANLMALSALAIHTLNPIFADRSDCLKDYAEQHPESATIFAAID
ncbi:antirestriction protein [Komagataeibacter europaeus]|uniref:antirestriction protein n=1 Tax=Komagataeibacter europaeus TaxID=33995 RepID=UPI0003143DCD|nr:antirestriction protein [Komagataeibacter europaeus]GBQ42020.1 antirestriction protein [Komagataeibacter europaeus LMG 18890]